MILHQAFHQNLHFRTSWNWTFLLLICTVIICHQVPTAFADRPLVTLTDDKNRPNIQLVSYRLSNQVVYDYYGGRSLGIKNVNLSTILPEDIAVKENNTWVISQNIAMVTFSCTARYPIQWIHDTPDGVDEFDVQSISRRAYIFRTAENFSNPDTYAYRVDLQFRFHHSGNSGQYTCESAGKSSLASQIYIYFEGLTGRIFPESVLHHVFTIGVNNQENLVIPCYTSLPDIPVILYRRGLYGSPDIDLEIDFLPLEFNDTGIISFDNKIGFTINVLNFTRAIKDTIEGTYKCTTNVTDDTDDHLIIHVLNEYTNNRLDVFQEYVKDNASFYVSGAGTARNKEISCCSSSAVVPTLVNVRCADPVSCNMMYPHKPTVDLSDPLYRRGQVNGSCITEYLWLDETGMYGCFGDGVNSVIHYYSSACLNNYRSFKLYSDWSEIEPELLIEVGKYSHPLDGYYSRFHFKPFLRHDKLDVEYYAGESATFVCQPKSYYFAAGTRWQLRFKNKTVMPIEKLSSRFGNNVYSLEDDVAYDDGLSLGNMDAIVEEKHYQLLNIIVNLTFSLEMESLSCLAPVWNSSEWTEKSLSLRVKPSFLPEWECGEFQSEAQYWPLGEDEDVTISCSIEGDPLPTFSVQKDGRLLKENEPEYELRVTTSTTTNKTEVTILRKTVTHDSHGVYTFVAHNFAGERRADIVVFVYERENWAFNILLVIGIGVGILTMGVLAFRTIVQRKTGNSMNVSYVNYKTENDDNEEEIQPEL